jgi:hypothetical protein
VILVDLDDHEILQQWFDITAPIPKEYIEECIDQMMLYAIKDGYDPEHPECKAHYRKMRKSVKKHNESFQ